MVNLFCQRYQPRASTRHGTYTIREDGCESLEPSLPVGRLVQEWQCALRQVAEEMRYPPPESVPFLSGLLRLADGLHLVTGVPQHVVTYFRTGENRSFRGKPQKERKHVYQVIGTSCRHRIFQHTPRKLVRIHIKHQVGSHRQYRKIGKQGNEVSHVTFTDKDAYCHL